MWVVAGFERHASFDLMLPHRMQNDQTVSRRHPIVHEDVVGIVGNDLPWSRFASKTILISGANGFLPACMVETLAYLNETDMQPKCRIIALVRNREKAEKRFAHLLGRPDFSLLVQDV